ncbi:MAG: beta-ketoacyl synthase N-terminal-like domain-containing protein [Planctomycetota bacterium]
MRRRVVISGLGVVTGLGVGLEPFWEGFVEGRSALGPIERFDTSGFASQLGSDVRDFTAKTWVPKSYRKAVKVMARDIELAVAAAQMAADDAGLKTRAGADDDSEMTYPAGRTGAHIGAGLIAADTTELASAFVTASDGDSSTFEWARWGTGEGGDGAMNNLPPLWLLKYLPNMLSCHVSIIHGACGPSNTHTNAEASGLLAIGESSRVIERGQADVCFAGSAESKVNPMGWMRMTKAGRLAETPAAGDGSAYVRPFDPESPGMLLGEAGGILILEESESAKARGARVYAEVEGFGAGQGAPPFLPPWPAPDQTPADEGLIGAIERALADAGTDADSIDAIVPHGLGAPSADTAEAGALRAVFGDRLGEIPLLTWTPNIGGCVAGNGGVQAALAAKALAEGVLPARVHAGRPAEGLRAGSGASEKRSMRRVLVCASAYGGQSAALIVRAAD